MRQVNSLREFSFDHYIESFAGKNCEESVQLAKEWEERKGNVKLVSYYNQKAGKGRAILVSYRFIGE